MSYLLKKHLSLSILLLLLIYKPVNAFDGMIQFFFPFVAQGAYDNWNGRQTYVQKYGEKSRFFFDLQYIRVGYCKKYTSKYMSGKACKQPDGSWKIR